MADKGISLIVTKGSETIEISQLVQKNHLEGPQRLVIQDTYRQSD